MALKRSLSSSSDDGETSQNAALPVASTSTSVTKVSRSSTETSSSIAPLLCTLPPACNQRPTRFDAYHELEAHHRTAHSHVCAAPKCNKVFPDARFLDLHLAECHDTAAEIQRERGQPTYRCFELDCPRVFKTVKGRRRHLIDTHTYPKAFFFALPLYGIGELFARYGPGASLVGPGWKPRTEATTSQGSTSSSPAPYEGADSPPSEAPPSPDKRLLGRAAAFPEPTAPVYNGGDVDELVNTLQRTKLDMVPTQIRFGRGQRGRLLGRGLGRKDGRTEGSTSMDVQ